MSMKQTFSVLATVAVVLWGGPAEAQLAKRGTYTARFYFQAHEKWYIIENAHYFFVGELSGTFFNDAGDGFLHRASAVCPGVSDVVKDITHAHRYCVITDEDNDRAVLVYTCKGQERCEGDAEWLGGTGKYTGLKGRQTISAARLRMGDRGESTGYMILKGEWQLQD
jgi:hypothetical protein